MTAYRRSVMDLTPEEVEVAPKCPALGCGANVLRPKCLFELNPDSCPRHEVRDAYLASFPDTRSILVGEANPYGGDPAYALYPRPENSAGGRLCRLIMGLEVGTYLRRFDRRNLCAEKWAMAEARRTAAEILEAAGTGRVVVLFGAKVCSAFRVAFRPFEADQWFGGPRFVVLPHPSGLSRAWNEPGAYERARRVLEEARVL